MINARKRIVRVFECLGIALLLLSTLLMPNQISADDGNNLPPKLCNVCGNCTGACTNTTACGPTCSGCSCAVLVAGCTTCLCVNAGLTFCNCS
jgi:hypothetical protein